MPNNQSNPIITPIEKQALRDWYRSLLSYLRNPDLKEHFIEEFLFQYQIHKRHHRRNSNTINPPKEEIAAILHSMSLDLSEEDLNTITNNDPIRPPQPTLEQEFFQRSQTTNPKPDDSRRQVLKHRAEEGLTTREVNGFGRTLVKHLIEEGLLTPAGANTTQQEPTP